MKKAVPLFFVEFIKIFNIQVSELLSGMVSNKILTQYDYFVKISLVDNITLRYCIAKGSGPKSGGPFACDIIK